MYRPRHRREKLLSSHVDLLRWLGNIQLGMGVILFILGVAMVAVDLDHWVARPDNGELHHRVTNKDRVLEPQPLASVNAMFLAMPMITLAVGAGMAGNIMSRYKGLAYNIPARHLLLLVSAMNAVMSLGYMVFQGMLTFEFIDAELLDSDNGWEQAVLALQLVIFILTFFNIFFAVVTVIVAMRWNPPMEPERINDRSLERERPMVPDSSPYYPRTYSDYSPYYGGGYGRNMPAIQYY